MLISLEILGTDEAVVNEAFEWLNSEQAAETG
jgi:hypothetical protein